MNPLAPLAALAGGLGAMPLMMAPQAKGPSCYRIFAMLQNGWRPAKRTVIVAELTGHPKKKEWIPSYRAKFIPRKKSKYAK